MTKQYEEWILSDWGLTELVEELEEDENVTNIEYGKTGEGWYCKWTEKE